MTEATLRHWRNGHREIKFHEFLKLCEKVGISPTMLLSDVAKDPFLSQLIFFYEGITDQERRDKLLGRANALYLEENPQPSIAGPYGNIPLPGSAKRSRVRRDS